jgi:hypothetical protein
MHLPKACEAYNRQPAMDNHFRTITIPCDRKGSPRKLPADAYIGGAIPRPTFTRLATKLPSGCLVAAEM